MKRSCDIGGSTTQCFFLSDDKTWTAYLFGRQNPAGIHLERWGHIYGCGRWFNVARDTRTHEILKTYVMGLPPPDLNDA